jgi:sec-independent protein translocase protein TatA
MIGSQDLIVGLVIVLVLFGAKKLPELANSIGKSMKEFKKGVSGDAGEEESPKPVSAPPAVTATATVPATGTCVSCQGSLEPDWKHCPRCGASAKSGSAPSSQPLG